MRQLYAIEYGATSEEGEKRLKLEILVSSSDGDAFTHALQKSYRSFNKTHGWRDHYARTSISYSLVEVVKFMTTDK